MRTALVEIARRNLNPEDALRFVQGESLPVPVNQTLGQVTDDPAVQMVENLARKGSFDSRAQTIATNQQNRALSQVDENIPAIQERIGGGQITGLGESGATAQNALVQSQRNTGRAVSQAFKVAENSPALVTREAVDGLAGRVAQAPGSRVRFSPKAEAQIDELRSLSQRETEPGVLVDRLFDWRRTTTTLANEAADQTEASALRLMVKEFDNNIETVVKNNLLAGEDDAARMWLRAIGIRRGQGRRFEADDLIADLLETERAGGGVRLKVAPEAASNLIFGASNTGILTRPQLARELIRLRDRLGVDSDAWNAIREEAFLRLVDQASRAGGRFSGLTFEKTLSNALRKNAPVMAVLFTKQDKSLLRQFAQVSKRVTSPKPGGDNPSGSGVALLNRFVTGALNRTLIGQKGVSVLSNIFPLGADILQGVRLGGQLRSGLPTPPRPQGVGAGVAVGMNELGERGRAVVYRSRSGIFVRSSPL